MKDFSEFTSINQTTDGLFKKGEEGILDILTPKDKKSEFIRYKNKTIINLKSFMGASTLYMLPETSFEPKAKAVLMDLDGTSVKSETFWIWIIEKTMKELLGKPQFTLEQEDIPFVSGFALSEHLSYCIEKYGSAQTVDEARSIYFKITSYEMKEILNGRGKQDAFTPANGLKEVLLTLKSEGVKIGLVTSGLYEKAMPEILSAFRQLGLGNPIEFYDALITAGTTFHSEYGGTLTELPVKPHPWPYAETCKIGLGIPDSENSKVIAVEDSSAGLMSAMLAGYEVIGIDDGNIPASGLEGLLYKKVDSLTDILNEIL